MRPPAGLDHADALATWQRLMNLKERDAQIILTFLRFSKLLSTHCLAVWSAELEHWATSSSSRIWAGVLLKITSIVHCS